MTLAEEQSQAAEQLELNSGIGADLHHLREQAGLSIEDVATSTRIQADYIAALEDGRQQDLPGAAYAIGFLRTYADYLGLDADEAVERFKDEEAVRANPTPLVFPSPLGETRRPGWRLALLSLLLAGVVYGTWVSIRNIGTEDLERILPPPERLTDFLKSSDQDSTPPATDGKSDAASDSLKIAGPAPTKQPDDGKIDASQPLTEDNTVTLKTVADTVKPATSPVGQTQAQQTEESDQPAAPVKPAPDTAEAASPSAAPSETTPAADAAATPAEIKPVQAVAVNQDSDGGSDTSAETQSAGPAVTVEKPTPVDAVTATAAPRDETPAGQSSETASEDTASQTPATSIQDSTPSNDEGSPAQSPASQTTSASQEQGAAGQGDALDNNPATPREDPEVSPPVAPPSPPQIAAGSSEQTPISPESRMAEPIPPGQIIALQSEPRTPNGQPRVFGASNAGARVVVKAHSDSWVQVQGPNKETLLTRILHAGDTYLAPSRDDLVLVTGNAGAVEIIVDGESLGMIGEFGQVRRDLSLDPDRVRNELANR